MAGREDAFLSAFLYGHSIDCTDSMPSSGSDHLVTCYTLRELHLTLLDCTRFTHIDSGSFSVPPPNQKPGHKDGSNRDYQKAKAYNV
jgi:hypothetical protein